MRQGQEGGGRVGGWADTYLPGAEAPDAAGGSIVC